MTLYSLIYNFICGLVRAFRGSKYTKQKNVCKMQQKEREEGKRAANSLKETKHLPICPKSLKAHMLYCIYTICLNKVIFHVTSPTFAPIYAKALILYVLQLRYWGSV